MTDSPNYTGQDGRPEPSAYLLFIDTESQAYWQPLPEGMPNYIQAWLTHSKAKNGQPESKWLLSAVGSALDDWMFQDWASDITVNLEFYRREDLLPQLLNAIADGFSVLDHEISLFEISSTLREAVQRVGEQIAETTNA